MISPLFPYPPLLLSYQNLPFNGTDDDDVKVNSVNEEVNTACLPLDDTIIAKAPQIPAEPCCQCHRKSRTCSFLGPKANLTCFKRNLQVLLLLQIFKPVSALDDGEEKGSWLVVVVRAKRGIEMERTVPSVQVRNVCVRSPCATAK